MKIKMFNLNLMKMLIKDVRENMNILNIFDILIYFIVLFNIKVMNLVWFVILNDCIV